jgi:putative drug exporter of the RND superfamily
VVFVTLVLLLRAVVAPLYLVATVILSYLSSLGIGVLVLQLIGDRSLDASMPGMAFIVLVAVGADYNMLLISRIRDESPQGIRSGVIRTVRSTGGVITSAGIIFAAPMLAMLFSSISSIVQAGLVIGVGLLVDTFVVRTITVPALAVLIGKANWWPSGWRPTGWKRRGQAASVGASFS